MFADENRSVMVLQVYNTKRKMARVRCDLKEIRDRDFGIILPAPIASGRLLGV